MTNFPYSDFSIFANWRPIRFTLKYLLEEAARNGTYLPCIFQLPGFILDFVDADFMHTSDLGVHANILFEMFLEMKGVISSPEETFADILVLIRTASKALRMEGPPINRIDYLMVRSKKHLKLKVKAAESRGLLKCLVFVLETLMPPTDDHDRLRLQMVFHVMENLGPDSPTSVSEYSRKALLLYGELQKEAVRTHGPSTEHWRIYPKFHLFLHCVEDQIASSGNPRLNWCYSDESEIGAAVRVAEAGHPSTIHRVVLVKHRLSKAVG